MGGQGAQVASPSINGKTESSNMAPFWAAYNNLNGQADTLGQSVAQWDPYTTAQSAANPVGKVSVAKAASASPADAQQAASAGGYTDATGAPTVRAQQVAPVQGVTGAKVLGTQNVTGATGQAAQVGPAAQAQFGGINETGQAGQNQNDLINLQMQAARGEGPSVAGRQIQQGVGAGIAAQQAAAASARGMGAGSAGRQAAMQASNLEAQGAANAGLQRMQEQQAAQQMAGQTIGQARGQNIDLATQNAAMGLQAGQFNAAAQNANALQNAQMAQQMGLANMSNEQQANLANQNMGFQVGSQNATMAMQQQLANQNAALQSASQNANMGMQAQLANQQAGNQLGMFNAGNQLQNNQFNAQLAQQMGMFNAGNQQQTNLANAANQQQSGMYNAGSQNAQNLATQGYNAQIAQGNTQAQMQQRQQQAAMLASLLGYQSGNVGAAAGTLQNFMNMQNGVNQFNAGAQDRGNASYNQTAGQGISAGTSAALMMLPLLMSDERAKTDVETPTKAQIGELLSVARPHTYRYKDPAQEGSAPGVHLSPMAQELEQTELGRAMVEEGPDGYKRVNYARGFGAILATMAHQHDRIEALERGRR